MHLRLCNSKVKVTSERPISLAVYKGMVYSVFSVNQDPLCKRRRREHVPLDNARYYLFVGHDRKFWNKAYKSTKNDAILLLESRKNIGGKQYSMKG